MALEKISLKNFTVFDELDLQFSKGINVFIGSNGTGKTHLMKLLYSACRATNTKTSFSNKLVRCFAPDDHKISRLARRKQGNNDASVRITGRAPESGKTNILTASFSNLTKKWDAIVTGEDSWEKDMVDLESVFIPAKEILSHSRNLNAAVDMGNVSFDETYLDIINAAKIKISTGKNPAIKQKLLTQIEKIVEGKVHYDEKQDQFYLKQGSSKVEFNLVAEGIRKIGLLWQLAKNGILIDGTVLFWDEPEANINPAHIPVIVDILLELQRNGVQVFVSTHDYIFAKYFEVKRISQDNVQFHALYQTEHGVKSETNQNFRDLEHNTIMSAFDQLLDEVYEARVED